jgi:endonuclease/exonuclease/phosphatase family metal-dependent hydrolase
VRVLAYNVRSLRDDVDALVSLIRAVDPDVLLMQEAPRFLGWKASLARFAHRCGLVVVTGGRVAGAMAVLARLDVRVVSTHDELLPKTPRLHQRGIAAAVVEVAGQRVGVASIHLGLRADERLRHAAEINRRLLTIDPAMPWVIGGDLNEPPGSPAWKVIADGRQDGLLVAQQPLGELTYSSTEPVRRIDAIFVPSDWSVRTAGVPETHQALISTASDHRPVLLETT